MTKEEVRIALGLDAEPVKRELAKTESLFSSWGGRLKSNFIRIGFSLAAAFSVKSIIAGIDQLAQKIEEVDRRFDTSSVKKVVSEVQIAELSDEERAKTVGGAATSGLASGAVKEAILRDSLIKRGLDWLRQSKQVGEGILGTNIKQEALAKKTEEREKVRKHQLEFEEEQKEYIIKLAKLGLDLKKEEANQAERTARAEAKKAEEIAKANDNLQNSIAGYNRKFDDLSATSFAEAARITDEARGLLNVPQLQFSREQMDIIDRVRILEQQSRQSRIRGDKTGAERLTSERLGLMEQLGFLPESDMLLKDVRENVIKQAQALTDLVNGRSQPIPVLAYGGE